MYQKMTMSGTFIDKQNVLKNLTPIVSMGVSQGGSSDLAFGQQQKMFLYFE